MEAGTDYKFRDDLFNPKEDGSTVPIEILIEPFVGERYIVNEIIYVCNYSFLNHSKLLYYRLKIII